MSEKEIYKNLCKKRHQKNYRGSFGNYCCTAGCQSAFYDANRVKTGIVPFKLPKNVAFVRNGCKLLKDIGVLKEMINLVKGKK